MKDYVLEYIKEQKSALDSIPADKVAELIAIMKKAWQEDRQLFVFGNGGSAANASHFITDLGKGAFPKLALLPDGLQAVCAYERDGQIVTKVVALK